MVIAYTASLVTAHEVGAPVLRHRFFVDRRILPFENARPIEFDVGVVLLDQPDGRLIEGRATDPHAWRGSKPVQDTRAGFAAAPAASRMHHKRVFVPALVAGKPQVRQVYFLF